MSTIKHIRTKVFGCASQEAFAAIIGVHQGTVCRWERGDLEPIRSNLDRIRKAAIERGIEWDDRLFFESPVEPREVA